jgi:plastocyanin
VKPAFAALLMALAPAAWAATHTVVIDGMQFQPAELTVKRGDRVVWLNRDVVPHTVKAGETFESPAIPPGASWAVTMTKRGRHAYACTLHPLMKATLEVRAR